jgi:hypothetical protein
MRLPHLLPVFSRQRVSGLTEVASWRWWAFSTEEDAHLHFKM